MFTNTTFMALLIAAGLVASPALAAQPLDSATRDSVSAQAALSPYSDAELRSFAIAAIEVQNIAQVYQAQMALASNSAEEQQVSQAASLAVVSAVEQQGLSIARFQEILAAARNDPMLAEKIDGALDERSPVDGARS